MKSGAQPKQHMNVPFKMQIRLIFLHMFLSKKGTYTQVWKDLNLLYRLVTKGYIFF